MCIEACATIFLERAERETSWKTCIYYVENSNMETSLILLIIVEIGAVKYMISRQVCKRTNTLIREEHSNSGAVRIDSRGSCSKHSAENHMLRQYGHWVFCFFGPIIIALMEFVWVGG